MPIVVRLRHETFTEPASWARLAATAATSGELVLVGAYQDMPEGWMSQLRRMLAPRHMLAVGVDDDVRATERALIEKLLNRGVIPVILTADDAPADLMSWLDTRARRPRGPGRQAAPHGWPRGAPRPPRRPRPPRGPG
jgi:hypothetical protein